MPIDNIPAAFNNVQEFVKNTLTSLNFLNPFGAQAPQLRYPKGDVQKHQNVIIR